MADGQIDMSDHNAAATETDVMHQKSPSDQELREEVRRPHDKAGNDEHPIHNICNREFNFHRRCKNCSRSSGSSRKLFQKHLEELNILLLRMIDLIQWKNLSVKQQHEGNRQTDHHGEHWTKRAFFRRRRRRESRPFCKADLKDKG